MSIHQFLSKGRSAIIYLSSLSLGLKTRTKIKGAVFLIILSCCGLIHTHGFGQEPKESDLMALLADRNLYPQMVHGIRWIGDGRYFSSIQQTPEKKSSVLLKYVITTGILADTLFDTSQFSETEANLTFNNYSFNKNESMILIATRENSVYRRSTVADYYVYKISSGALTKVSPEGRESYATFSPDGSKVAYVFENNLYYKDLAADKIHQVTHDGKVNEIINGSSDWVYEEEFRLTKAFFWSPDSKKLAYYVFDESRVREFTLQRWDDIYPENVTYKYPKAGELNSEISIKVFHLDQQKSVAIDLGEETDIYIPRITWAGNPGLLAIIKLNRLQNHLEILHADVSTGSAKRILEETSETYLDFNFNDKLIYLDNNTGFLRTSEQDGYKHIYLYRMDGNLKRQLTSGSWLVDEIAGYDQKKGIIYFLSTENSALERQLYKVNLDGKRKKQLSEAPGIHEVDFSPNFKYYLDYYSSVEHSLEISLINTSNGETIRTLQQNDQVKASYQKKSLGKIEFFSFESGGQELDGYIIKPVDFDSTKNYPLLLYVYGGPGSQNVKNQWIGGSRGIWHRFLTKQGFIVACVDNRGTGGKGKAFQHVTYGKLGEFETSDQINAARYLGNLSFIDKNKIGIWGWSYGGYVAALAVMKGEEVFNAAIAVAPVKNSTTKPTRLRSFCAG